MARAVEQSWHQKEGLGLQWELLLSSFTMQGDGKVRTWLLGVHSTTHLKPFPISHFHGHLLQSWSAGAMVAPRGQAQGARLRSHIPIEKDQQISAVGPFSLACVCYSLGRKEAIRKVLFALPREMYLISVLL